MDILFANNAKTLLNGAILIDATSIVVDDGSDFPSPTGSQFFYATLQNPVDDTDYEIVKCTARTGNTLTVTREQEGTTHQAWSDGTLCELRLTAGAIDELEAHQADHLSGGSAEVDGDKIDIDFNPTYSTPAVTPSEVDGIDQLTAHLYGIDQAIKPSSQDARGTIELATHAEAQTGTETGMAVTPSALTAVLKQQSWLQEDGYYIGTDKIRARDGDGLDLEDDGGNGLHVADGGAVTSDGDLILSKTLKTFQGSDVASANDMTLGDGNFFDITGTTTINTIVTKAVGTFVILQFDGILQLTHSADLFLPTAGNITTAAGDIATFYEYASGDWRCLLYQRANGTALSALSGAVDISGTPVANDVARFTDGDTVEGRSYTELKGDLNLVIGTDVLAEQTIGIANDNLLEVDGTPLDTEVAVFTANGINGLSTAEMKSLLSYLTDLVDDTAPKLGGVLDTNSKMVMQSMGIDVASATNVTLGDDGNAFDITGTTTIATIVTKGIGTVVTLQFDGILQLTHSADLVLPTAANITTAAGDIAVFYEYAAGDWRCAVYTRADGTVLAGGSGSGMLSESVNDESEITLDTGKTGWGQAMAGDNEEYIEFRFTAAGVVTVISNSANAVGADTDGNLCVYDAGTGIAIKNRLGATKTIRYVVNYS